MFLRSFGGRKLRQNGFNMGPKGGPKWHQKGYPKKRPTLYKHYTKMIAKQKRTNMVPSMIQKLIQNDTKTDPR